MPAAELAGLFAAGELHVRLNALRLLVRIGKWDGLAWALRACGDADPRIARIAQGQVAQWIGRSNRSFAEPTPEQATRVGEALRNAAGCLPDVQRSRLMSSLPATVRAAVTKEARR